MFIAKKRVKECVQAGFGRMYFAGQGEQYDNSSQMCSRI